MRALVLVLLVAGSACVNLSAGGVAGVARTRDKTYFVAEAPVGAELVDKDDQVPDGQTMFVFLGVSPRIAVTSGKTSVAFMTYVGASYHRGRFVYGWRASWGIWDPDRPSFGFRIQPLFEVKRGPAWSRDTGCQSWSRAHHRLLGVLPGIEYLRGQLAVSLAVSDREVSTVVCPGALEAL